VRRAPNFERTSKIHSSVCEWYCNYRPIGWQGSHEVRFHAVPIYSADFALANHLTNTVFDSRDPVLQSH